MKTLYINGRYLSQVVTGVQRYAHEVVAAWDADLAGGLIDPKRYAIEVIAPRDVLALPDYKCIRVSRSRTNGRFWEQVELPLRTKGGLLFSPYAAAPVFKFRHAVTIHDAGVRATPQQYSRLFRTYYTVVYKLLGIGCRRIFTVSQFSKDELGRYFSIPAHKVSVVPPGCDYLAGVTPDSRILQKFNLRPKQFILGVSSRSPIKNFNGLASAWRLLAQKDIPLAIAGKASERIFAHSDSAPQQEVKWLGYVSDQELRALYENAALFVYPSFYEGFGLPPMEAMSCGCPVLVARSSALPETCGDGALYCDPSSACEIAEKMAYVLNHPEVSKDLQRRGPQRAQEFTMDKTASLLWSELKDFL